MDFHRPDMKLGDNDVVRNGQQLIDQKLSADVTEARKMNLNAVLLSNFKNRFALVVAIAMTVITASCFVGAILYGNFISSAINICIGSIALVDCFGIWKLFAYDKQITPEGLKSFQRYASVQKVLNVVSMILFGLLAGVMIVISIALMIAFEQFSGNISEVVHSVGTLLDYQIPMDPEAISSFFLIGPTIIFITALIVIIFVTVYYTLINRALKNVIKYVDRLAACANGDVNYAIDQKPPFISLLVFSGVNALLTLLIPTDIGLWSIIYNLALCVYFVFIALLFRNIQKEIEKKEATYIGTAVHKFMELCDLEKLYDGSIEAELNRLVAEGDISSDDAERVQLRINEMERFRRSDVFREMLEAKRCEDAHMTMLLKEIRRTEYLEKMGLPRCIEEMDFGKLFDEIHVMTVIEQMRQSGDPRQIELADILDAEMLHYELPEEILQPTTLDKIRNSKLFEDIRKAKRLYREYPIFMPDVPSSMSPHTLAIPDCIIVKENGDIKIVDFKTDRLEKAELKNEAKATETFSFSYSPQFAKYADAVKLEFGKKPASAKLYSLQLGKALNIPINELPQKRYHYPEIKGRPS